MIAGNSLVSVVVPIYKVEAYLKRCVDSIVAQTYKNLEIILVDDGSPDGCPRMCDDFAKSDSRIKVIHKKNGGLADARNAGLDIASGQYVAFIDSDDFIHTDYIEVLLDSMESKEADIAVAGFCKFTSENVVVKAINEGAGKNISLKEAILSYCSLNSTESATFISCCNKLYKRELFDALRFPKGKLNEDAFVSYQLLANAQNRIVMVNEPLYYYYIRNDSIVGSVFSKRNLDVLDAYHNAVKWFDEKNEKDLSLCFYPPLLMREIFCWWGSKYILENSEMSERILNDYRNDCKMLADVNSVSWKWKSAFRLFSRVPWLYALYRKFSPVRIGDR